MLLTTVVASAGVSRPGFQRFGLLPANYRKRSLPRRVLPR